jgi:hypothetical protein
MTASAAKMSFRAGARCARLCFGTVVTLWAAAACAPVPETRTVSYYRENPDALKAQLYACQEDPGTLHDTPNCINAREALRQEGRGSLRDLPAMGLPTEAAPRAEPAQSQDKVPATR